MMFRRSSKCQMEQCVEVGGRFRAASRCESHTCVEVGRPGGTDVVVRDSKLPDTAPLLRVSPQAWTALIGMISA